MNNIIINDYCLQIKEYEGKRVVVFTDIDKVHNRPDGTARKRFTYNKKHFVENEDFFFVKYYQNYEGYAFAIPERGITLITESGYLLLVKSFKDDNSYKTQKQLLERYFRKEDCNEIQKVDKETEKIENKVNAIDSREIAEMLDIEHSKMIRKLEGSNSRKGIIEILTEAQMGVSDYFIESTYKDTSGKQNKCYLFTKMGCEFIANKFTGEKGIIFTAKYVKKFNDMEQSFIQPKAQYVLPESKEMNIDIKTAYKQATFISKLMEEAGESATSKLNAVNKIYSSVGIDLLENQPTYKSATDLEFDMLFQETVNKFSEMSDYECKDYIIGIKNDTTISEKLKKNLLALYINAYKVVVKNKLML